MSDPYTQRRPDPRGYAVEPQPRHMHRAARDHSQPGQYGHTGRQLTAAEQFWYVLGNIGLAAMYFAKIPAKKAMADAGLCELTGAEKFWYVVECIGLGAGYFAKIPVAKALTELDAYR